MLVYRGRRLFTVALLLALVSAACGDDDDTGGSATSAPAASSEPTSAPTEPVTTTASSTDATESTAPPETTTQPTETTVAPPTGEPIRIGSLTSVTGELITLPYIKSALEAAVDGVNSRGGVAGRPLEIDVCDDGGTPDGALACGRDFVDDESLVASVGVDSVPGQDYGSVLGDAGVAIIGAIPSSTWEISAPTSFPFIGGTLAYYQALAAVGKGYEKVALIRIDIAQSAVIAALFKTLGLEVVADVAVPATATDVSPQVTQALESGADAVVLALAEPGLSLVIQGIYQQAEDSVAILTTGEQFDADAMAALGDASSILYGVLGLPPASAAADHESVQLFLDDMEAFGDDESKINGLSLGAHSAVLFFAQLADQILSDGGELTRASVLEAMSTCSDCALGDLTRPLDFTKPLEGLPLPFPRLFNVDYYTATGSPDGWLLDGDRHAGQ